MSSTRKFHSEDSIHEMRSVDANKNMNDLEINSLGQQQRRALEIVWQRGGATVQEVLDEMNTASDTQLAYTTVLKHSKKPAGSDMIESRAKTTQSVVGLTFITRHAPATRPSAVHCGNLLKIFLMATKRCCFSIFSRTRN